MIGLISEELPGLRSLDPANEVKRSQRMGGFGKDLQQMTFKRDRGSKWLDLSLFQR